MADLELAVRISVEAQGQRGRAVVTTAKSAGRRFVGDDEELKIE